MAYQLVLLDRFMIVLGLGLIASFMFLVAGGYNLVKLYYYMQMSSDMSRASKLILRIFFYGMFAPIMVLFFANDVVIPLWAYPTVEQIALHNSGQLDTPLIRHTLNTGGIYLVLIGVVGMTLLLYYYFNKQQKERLRKKEAEEINRRLEEGH